MAHSRILDQLDLISRGQITVEPNDYKDLLMLVGVSEDEADKKATKYLKSITPK
jgi:hypothetical protein